MIPWKLLDQVSFPGGGALRLYNRGEEFSINLDASILMNSSLHASEDGLASIACARFRGKPKPAILIGGLGMGYTLAEALKRVGPGARLVVAEIVPAVVKWNRGPLSHLAGHPLKDRRVTVLEQDVAETIRAGREVYSAILLDVDNSPEGLTREVNNWLYSPAGLEAAFSALQPRGVLGVWSARPDRKFVKRLKKAGFRVEEIAARARNKHRGGHHIIWMAERPG
ncbi:MAG: hypothetical protein ABIJ96_08480 [Elusimicrobiota bacterium]